MGVGGAFGASVSKRLKPGCYRISNEPRAIRLNGRIIKVASGYLSFDSFKGIKAGFDLSEVPRVLLKVSFSGGGGLCFS